MFKLIFFNVCLRKILRLRSLASTQTRFGAGCRERLTGRQLSGKEPRIGAAGEAVSGGQALQSVRPVRDRVDHDEVRLELPEDDLIRKASQQRPLGAMAPDWKLAGVGFESVQLAVQLGQEVVSGLGTSSAMERNSLLELFRRFEVILKRQESAMACS